MLALLLGEEVSSVFQEVACFMPTYIQKENKSVIIAEFHPRVLVHPLEF